MPAQVLTQITFADIDLTNGKNAKPIIGKWQEKVFDLVRDSEILDFEKFHSKRTDYPRIQYRNVGGAATIVGIGKEAPFQVGRFAELMTEKYPERTKNVIQTTEYYTPKLQSQPIRYVIDPYLFPQNMRRRYQSKKQLWQDAEAVEQRLEQNIFELVHKVLEFEFPKTFELRLLDISSPKEYHTYKAYGKFFEKGVRLVFECNLNLPRLGAIGTGKSKGYGQITYDG